MGRDSRRDVRDPPCIGPIENFFDTLSLTHVFSEIFAPATSPRACGTEALSDSHVLQITHP